MSVLHLACAPLRLVWSAVSSKSLIAFLMGKDGLFQLLLTSLSLGSQIIFSIV